MAEFPPGAMDSCHEWVKVYDLSEDSETTTLIHNASLNTADFGYKPEVAVFGSVAWWNAIKNGDIEHFILEGKIISLPVTGHGDWPGVEVLSGNETTRWSRFGKQNAYQIGASVRIKYVNQYLKKSRLQKEPARQVLTISVKNCG